MYTTSLIHMHTPHFICYSEKFQRTDTLLNTKADETFMSQWGKISGGQEWGEKHKKGLLPQLAHPDESLSSRLIRTLNRGTPPYGLKIICPAVGL